MGVRMSVSEESLVILSKRKGSNEPTNCWLRGLFRCLIFFLSSNFYVHPSQRKLPSDTKFISNRNDLLFFKNTKTQKAICSKYFLILSHVFPLGTSNDVIIFTKNFFILPIFVKKNCNIYRFVSTI